MFPVCVKNQQEGKNMKFKVAKRAMALCVTAAMVITGCPSALVSAEEIQDVQDVFSSEDVIEVGGGY